MEEFGALDSSEETISILGDRWWAQAVKQEGDNSLIFFLRVIWKQRNDRPIAVRGVSVRSRNGVPSVSKGMRGQW